MGEVVDRNSSILGPFPGLGSQDWLTITTCTHLRICTHLHTQHNHRRHRMCLEKFIFTGSYRPPYVSWFDTKPSHEQIIQLVQRALALVGNTSHSISIERRRTAWARINPTLKSLAEEEYDKQEGNLFGPGFLEKASKKIEAEKAMA